MAKTMEAAGYKTDPEFDLIDNKLTDAADDLLDLGCNPGWVAHGAIRTACLLWTDFPPEDQTFFIESLEQTLEKLKEIQPLKGKNA
ncbi:MAG: hypothetical protein V2I43_28955 [Parvularcula sp.]|jgi:hypothetical protein|nr:hypothetical protein [Parvularcula sp.]